MKSRPRLALAALLFFASALHAAPVPVTVDNFARAESDLYFAQRVASGGLGRIVHTREVTPIDSQTVVRMNRDTLYSSGVFDLAAGDVTLTLPDTGKRFMSLLLINQDHYVVDILYQPGPHRITRARAGTRYLYAIVRTLVDANSPADIAAAHAAQDGIRVAQAGVGRWEAPQWDPASQAKVRDALGVLGTTLASSDHAFGARDAVKPVDHLIGVAIGWGGNPVKEARYLNVVPAANDGTVVHSLTVKDVPVDGFWSITLYNEKGYMEKNEHGAYSLNNLTAQPNPDGSITVRFGGDRKGAANWLPIMPGWNYTVRLYRPRQELLSGAWTFPQAQPVK
jgi:para-nitrobenzyl esterase